MTPMAVKTGRGRSIFYGVLFLLLAGGYAWTLMDWSRVPVPTAGRIEGRLSKEAELKQRRDRLVAMNRERAMQRHRVDMLTRSYWRSDAKRAPTNEVQSKIERLGNIAGVQLNRVGAPKVIEISDNVHAVEVQISSTASIKQIARFFRQIENHQPELVWQYCSIRPNRIKDPSGVLLSGRIRAYVLSKEASAYLAAGEDVRP